MNRVSQVSINSKHLRSAQRAIESYLYTLAHKHELLTWQGSRKSTGMRIETEDSLLNLGSESLNDAELIAVLPEIAKLNLVTTLELKQNYITGEGIKKILELLPNLEQLCLSSCRLDLNQGCLYLAQFKRLRFVCVASNNLTSTDLDALQASHSLTSVDFSDNPDVNIVSKARLFGALAYNNQTLFPYAGGSTHTDSKDSKEEEAKKKEYIRTTFELHRREVQKMEKLHADIAAVLRSPAPSLF